MSLRQLALENLTCVRGDRLLFKGLELRLEAGGAVLVRGANGAGKSSLLRVIAGLLKPYSGSVRTSGRIALADEYLALDRQILLGRALSFWAQLDGRGQSAINGAMEAMQLTHLAAVPVRMLSTGQRKRATIARVIASQGDIWLLDEPANGLDPASVALLDAAMAAHRAKGGIVVAASHQALGLDTPQLVEIGTS